MTAAAPWSRDEHLTRLEATERYDLVVVGGGIVGSGVALDAALRGLSVALVERADFASGTSSRSTKLLHGGVRYLPQFRWDLMRESLREQKVLAEIAGHLYQPLEFVIPLYKGGGFGNTPRWLGWPPILPGALRAGLRLYDSFGRRRENRSRRVSPEETKAAVPGLRAERLTGGMMYWDAQTDDARLVVSVLKAAVTRGQATAVNWTKATRITPRDTGYVIELEDRLGGNRFAVYGRAVVVAVGAFDPPPTTASCGILAVVSAKGAHLLVDSAEAGITSRAVVLPETDDKRVMFVIPWQGRAIVGTTDTPYRGDVARPVADAEDVDYLLRHLRRYIDASDLRPISAWAGIRALVGNRLGATRDAPRAHKVIEAAPGYVRVAGGKLTGYRLIAAQVTDQVAAHLGIGEPSVSHDNPLAGADADPGLRPRLPERAEEAGLDPEYGELLYSRYGSDAELLLDLLESRPDLRAGSADGSTLGEVAYAARYEAVATLADFCLRRTRLSLVTVDHGRGDAGRIGAVLGAELGWSDEELRRQMEWFEEELQAEGL